MHDQLLNEQEVSSETKISVNTLRWYRYMGDRGPRYIKAGRSVRYSRDDLNAWLDAGRVEIGGSSK